MKICKFCVTRLGGYKYVAGKLRSIGDCGKCNGNITDAKEIKFLKKYIEEDLKKFQEYKESVQEIIDFLKMNIEEIDNELERINERPSIDK